MPALRTGGTMKSRTLFSLTAGLFLASALPAPAQSQALARRNDSAPTPSAARNSDRDRGLDNLASLRDAAAAGDPTAQFTLANHYFRGLGVSQDFDQALSLYRQAADQGFAAAQNRLGAMYEYGLAVPQSYGRAMTAYRMAAVQGHALAQYNLAMLYESGKGGRLDYAQALDWFRKAADQGEPEAEEEIGYFSQRGFLGPRDHAQAREWYKHAAEHGSTNAQNHGSLKPKAKARGPGLWEGPDPRGAESWEG